MSFLDKKRKSFVKFIAFISQKYYNLCVIEDDEMGALFNLDNPVWNFMGKVADLVILNMLAIVCSIPIFTIGASWTAVYFVTIRMVRKEEGYVIKDFFRSFKENFKQATIIWLLVLVVVAVFVGDILIYNMMPDQIPQIVMVIVAVLGFLALGTVVYVFPLLSRFENTTKNTIKNAFLLSIVNIPYTLIFIVLMIIPVILTVFVLEVFPIIIMVGFSLPAFLTSLMLVRIFRKLEPAEAVVENGENNEDPEEMEL